MMASYVATRSCRSLDPKQHVRSLGANPARCDCRGVRLFRLMNPLPTALKPTCLPPSMMPTGRRGTMLLVLDVDGVTRRAVTDDADPRVVALVKQIASYHEAPNGALRVQVAFLSGSALHDPESAADVDEWRTGNKGLRAAFQRSGFMASAAPPTTIAWPMVQVHGQLGQENSNRIVGHSASQVDALCRILLCQVATTRGLQSDLPLPAAFEETGAPPPPGFVVTQTPDSFRPAVAFLRGHADQRLRLIVVGAMVEVHLGAVPVEPGANAEAASWSSALPQFVTEVRRQLELDADLQHLTNSVFSGLAHRAGEEFAFVVIAKGDKAASCGS